MVIDVFENQGGTSAAVDLSGHGGGGMVDGHGDVLGSLISVQFG